MASGELTDFKVFKDDKVIAISTPIPGSNGEISKKTPVFHLPVYKINLQLDDGGQNVTFHCDLADLTDLISKLKSLENQWKNNLV